MDGMTLAYIVAIVLVIALGIHKKLRELRSNIPSPGLFWFRRANGKNVDDLREFAEKNNAGLVHSMIVAKTERNWISSLLSLKSHAIITHPDIAQIILRDEETFVKDNDSFGDVGLLLADSLVSSNGAQWRVYKDIMAPSFHFDAIRNAVPVFVRKTDELMDLWAENGGKNLDIRSDASHFTLDTLGLTAFNVDFGSIRGGIHDYLTAYHNFITPFPKTHSEISAAVAELSKLTKEIIASKDTAKDGAETKEKDFLDRILTGADKMTEEAIRDNTFMMFIAGHETTSTSLTWGLYHLAKFQDLQKQAQEEVDFVLKGTLPDSESVKSLTFLDMFIKEVLRHKPPAGTLISRKTTKDAQVGQYFIPEGTLIGLAIHTIHHLKEFWPDPEKFDPLRFSPERSVGRHPFAYMPFSLGRRNCIGNNFSLLEQKIFLAMVLQRYTLHVNESCQPEEYPLWQTCWPVKIVLDVTERPIYKRVKSVSA